MAIEIPVFEYVDPPYVLYGSLNFHKFPHLI